MRGRPFVAGLIVAVGSLAGGLLQAAPCVSVDRPQAPVDAEVKITIARPSASNVDRLVITRLYDSQRFEVGVSPGESEVPFRFGYVGTYELTTNLSGAVCQAVTENVSNATPPLQAGFVSGISYRSAKSPAASAGFFVGRHEILGGLEPSWGHSATRYVGVVEYRYQASRGSVGVGVRHLVSAQDGQAGGDGARDPETVGFIGAWIRLPPLGMSKLAGVDPSLGVIWSPVYTPFTTSTIPRRLSAFRFSVDFSRRFVRRH